MPLGVVNVRQTLTALAAERPIFHSEADFQHALAWELHRHAPTANIRLEYRFPGTDNPTYVDIWVHEGDKALALEVKYKPHALRVSVADEPFELRLHGANDQGRYDYLKDVQRLEDVVHRRPGTVGYAILLTNDASYWTSPRRIDQYDAAFRIHEGCTLSRSLEWHPKTGAKTKQGREEPIRLRNSCHLTWHHYSEVAGKGYTKFRYVLAEVQHSA